MNKKTVGVFFGSRAPEHDISIITGNLIINGLLGLGYKVIPIYIDKSGDWKINEKLSDIKTFKNPMIANSIRSEYYLDLKASTGKLTFRKIGIFSSVITIDLIFPAFHGQNGEDGTFQGLCEMLNVPYVGCDTTSSSITMDKVLTKILYQTEKIPTTKFLSITNVDWSNNKKDLIAKTKALNFPLIIKPARLGSSIGISKASNIKELEYSIEVALHFDSKIIVEKCIDDLMDITVCVIGNDEPITSLIQESVFQKDFFSYDDKYINKGGAQTGKATNNVIIPARLEEKTTKEIRDTAIRIYKLFGCSGIARVDFLYDKKTKNWYANEINTLPGTLYHHLWKASGIELDELLSRLIEYADEKYQAKKYLTSTFTSSVLSQTSSSKLALK